MLALSTLSSLLLGALLVLARADGAAWVRAALVGDLVCRTSCPTCSSVSCWLESALCVCKHCSLILQIKVFLWPARRPLHRCFLRLSLSPFHLLLLLLLLGREGAGGGGGQEEAGGPLAARDLQRPKNFIYTNPAQPAWKQKNTYLSLPQSPRRKRYLCGVL